MYCNVSGLGVSMYNMYVFTKKMYICINPLSRIRNTSLISAYYRLYCRECKCFNCLVPIRARIINVCSFPSNVFADVMSSVTSRSVRFSV
jgi:hypothetical protein